MAERGEVKPETSAVDENDTMITKLAESKTFDVATNTADESVNSGQSTTQFLDIAEVDVLAILRQLDIPDLISVAQTNRFLKKCADATVLSCHESFVNYLVISSPNQQFFRQFGHLVRELTVICSGIATADWHNKKLHILPVIADRCRENLKTLRLEYVCEDFSTLKKVDQDKVCKLFIRLRRLSIMDCSLNGWDKVMKPEQTNVETLSLQFIKKDSWQGYVRKYQKLKTLHISGFVSTELFHLNQSIQTINLYAESISRNNLKSIARLPSLKNVTIKIMGSDGDRSVIGSDFELLAKIQNLEYLYLMTAYFSPIKTSTYIATLMALQKHEKLTELHFFSQYFEPITATSASQFKETAFPKLKQLGIFDDFPFMNSVSKFRSIVDILIMESSTIHIEGLKHFRSIIVSMPKLKRLLFDVTADIDEACRESLVQMCESRTSKSKLVILIQNFKNNIVRASMYPKTVLMFSVHQPNMPTNPFIFDESVVNAFDRARLLAQRGGYVAVNYMDFNKGINSIGIRQPYD